MIRVCLAIVVLGLILSAGYQAAAQTAIEFSEADVWQHHIGPPKLLHSEHFDPQFRVGTDPVTLLLTIEADARAITL